ncbi:MAG: glycosyltransferase [Devosia nanyangense]|uniref:Glycosyltransferase n=1 Tax=Devosia nanyangense TaxID=1228055 RepID=A0A933L612_9HYPH|nr:glycosyltransferase [Devosia nanyangense]
MARHLVLISDAEATCGVEEFARQTARRLGGSGATHVLDADMPNLTKALAGAADLIINLPVVAWKKKLAAPILAAAHARMAGREVTIILHEWADLALARRLSYLPLLPLATRILFSAPEVMAQFESTPVSRIVTKRRAVVPIPPNFAVPGWTSGSARSDRLAADRAKGTMILAQFGSIYPKKDPLVLLDVAAELMRRGIELRLVFIGSFVKDGGTVEADFWARVEALGLKDRVEVTGYLKDAAKLYGLFAEVDAFVYPLSEGLTSRRASVLAAALSGRPVVVSAPQRADSLAHHRLFNVLLKAGTLQLVPRDATAAMFADAVLATRGMPHRPVMDGRQIDAVWSDLIATLSA